MTSVPNRAPGPAETANRKALLAAALAVAALTFIVFIPALHNSFVTWDDDLYVYDNYHIRSFDTALIRWAALSYYASNWHPLTWLSHAADYALWGLNPTGHHLTSVLLHSLNAGILVLLISRLWESARSLEPPDSGQWRWKAILSAAATGLLFGVHPLRVESVAWVAERKDVLCAFFFLLSLYAYAGPASRIPDNDGVEQQQKRHGYGSYLWAIVFFCLALLSKPMAVSLPLVLLILDWWPLGRMSRSSVSRVLLEKIPFVLLSIISSVITLKAQQAGGSIVRLQEIALTDRIMVACRSMVFYIAEVVFPAGLVPFHPYPKNISLFALAFLLPVLLIMGFTAICIVVIRRQRIWSAVWAYYLAAVFPVLGLVQVGDQAMADRYTYLPTIGFFFLAGAGLVAAAEMLRHKSRNTNMTTAACLAALMLLAAGLSFLSIRQMQVWKNDMTLWSRVIQSYPETARAYNNLGVALLKEGRVAEAGAMFSRALGIDNSNAETLNNLAICRLEAGEYREALGYALRAAAGETRNGDAYNTLGEAYFALNDFENALANYLRALSVRSDYPSRYFNTALALERLGRVDESCRYWDEYLRRGIDQPDLKDVMQHREALGCRPAGHR